MSLSWGEARRLHYGRWHICRACMTPGDGKCTSSSWRCCVYHVCQAEGGVAHAVNTRLPSHSYQHDKVGLVFFLFPGPAVMCRRRCYLLGVHENVARVALFYDVLQFGVLVYACEVLTMSFWREGLYFIDLFFFFTKFEKENSQFSLA